MVEVDVMWSYAIGAGFAFASGRHAEGKPTRQATFESTHFRDTVLFLACIFAPSGVALVWGFPDWETMHVGTREMPLWLVALFAATNVTQGILGFAVTRWLLARGRPYAAYLQWVAGYLGMFFMLVHGWDGTGYQRFFSPTAADLPGWTWDTALRWFGSPVAHLLYVEGVFLVPVLLFLTTRWIRQGWALSGRAAPLSAAGVGAQVLGFSVLVFPSLAILASVCVRYLGWPGGVAAFALALWAIALRRGGLLHRHFRELRDGVPYFAPSTPETEPRPGLSPAPEAS